jgi:hypothetical protein
MISWLSNVKRISIWTVSVRKERDLGDTRHACLSAIEVKPEKRKSKELIYECGERHIIADYVSLF